MATLNINQIHYRNISLLVRPARVAILLPTDDLHWKHFVISIIDWCSRVWGGAYFIIIPTDGKEIEEPFWQILMEYSPDHIYSYQPTFSDLETADPLKFSQIKEKYARSLKEKTPDIDEKEIDRFINENVRSKKSREFIIDQSLQEQLKQRLAPFFFGDYIVKPIIPANYSIPFPLTKLEILAKSGNLKKVVMCNQIRDIDCALAFYANWGSISENYIGIFESYDVQIEHIPENISLTDLLTIGITHQLEESDIQFRKNIHQSTDSQSWYPAEDITQNTPFKATLLKLAKYKIANPEYKIDPITLIIGDSIKEFCLYYCLSRFQEDIYWLPEIKLPSKEPKNSPADDRSVLSSVVVRTVYEKSRYPHPEKKIIITSISETAETLEIQKNLIPKILFFYSGDFSERIIVEKYPLSVKKDTYRLIEENNYTSQYTEVFENNRSIGIVPTPKPKNFGMIVPYEHRWITELNIDGYIPPTLHFLGNEIVDIHKLSTESRVAKTGICYNCPNIAYFGGDIDVTLVRPRLRIIEPDVIFQEYFKVVGYENVRASDKGNFTTATIEKFGSLDNVCQFFSNGRNLQLFSLFLEDRSSKKQETGEFVKVNDRVYIDFESVRNILGSEDEAIDLIDSFIQRGIFYRGIVLQCSRCKEADWHALGEFDQNFICKRCWHKQSIQQANWKEGREPNWFYKLDEVIYQGIKNNMQVPLLTLAFLKRQSKRNFLFTTELELRKSSGSSQPDIEIDICCIQDGCIILGECKKAAILKKTIDKLAIFSGTFLRPADKLVFSTFSSRISEEIISYAQTATSIPTLFLLGKDLILS